MQPMMWTPPIELSQPEEQIVKRIRKAKLFVFLRQHRHELFDEAFQRELASLYRKAERGQNPQWLRRCWLWHLSWRHIWVFPMTRLLRQR